MINVVDASPTDADLIHLARCVEPPSRRATPAITRSAPYWSAPTGPCRPKQEHGGHDRRCDRARETNLVRIATTAVDRALMAGSAM